MLKNKIGKRTTHTETRKFGPSGVEPTTYSLKAYSLYQLMEKILFRGNALSYVKMCVTQSNV